MVTFFRRKACCYDGFLSDKEPFTCDCKFGIDVAKPYEDQGEQTGCPELRCVEALLDNITDEEFEEISTRHFRRMQPDPEFMQAVKNKLDKKASVDNTTEQ